MKDGAVTNEREGNSPRAAWPRRRVPTGAGMSGVRLVASVSDEGDPDTANTAEAVVLLFERVAAEEGWNPDGELRAHVAVSTYFGLWADGDGATSPEGRPGAPSLPIGGLQLVRSDAAGWLPCDRVWPELAPPSAGAEGRTSVAHVAVLAVAREWRGRIGGLFWRLTAAMWRHCVLSGIADLYLEATPRTLRCYQRLGWPLEVRGELREHWGEPCYPCVLSVREVAGSLAERAVRSEAYRHILADMVGMDRHGQT